MKKFKINYDRPRPSSEEIASRKDFDGLLNQLGAAGQGPALQKPFWKTGWFAGALTVTAAAAVIVSATVFFNKGDVDPAGGTNTPQITNNGPTTREPELQNSVQAPKACIAPPLPGLDIPYSNYKVSSSKGANITYSTGSKIAIPAGAFVDEKGNTVKGEVDVKYRELHDPVDFFLSGIPMSYDSAGERYHFESAGMIDIAAFKDGKVVYLKPDKKVEVQLASSNPSTAFNLYQLDTTAHNWTYLGKDKVKTETVADPKAATEARLAAKNEEVKSVISQLEEKRDQEIAQVAKAMPVPDQPAQPKKADKKKNRFGVQELVAGQFPELEAYKGVNWEVIESPGEKFDKGLYDIDWEDISVTKGERKDAYVITLKKGIRIVKINVYPVFDGDNYAKAMEVYEKKFAEYNTALTNRKNEEERLRQEYEKQMADQRLAYQRYEEQLRREEAAMEKNKQVMRVFQISGFGVFNCDSPHRYPNGANIFAVFMGETNKQLFTKTNIFLVDKAMNGIFTYYANPTKEFRYNPSSQNVLWTVADGKLYTLMPEDFRKLSADNRQDVKLKAVEKEFKDAADMKAYFGIGI